MKVAFRAKSLLPVEASFQAAVRRSWVGCLGASRVQGLGGILTGSRQRGIQPVIVVQVFVHLLLADDPDRSVVLDAAVGL